MNIDKLIEEKYSEHQKELYDLEKRLEEYKERIWHNGKIVLRNIPSEKEIKIEEGYYKFVKSLKLLGFEHWGYSEPPLMKPKYPIMPSATSDWDFPNTNWVLDTTIYVSSPSSLKLNNITGNLCKYTGTTNLPQGRIKTYKRFSSTGSLHYTFRNQSPIGSFSYDNTYYFLVVYSGTYTLYREVGGILYTVASRSGQAYSANVWYLAQITWWNDVGGAGLMVRYEYPIGTKVIPDINDSVNQWATSTINRCGLYNPTSYALYLDDTEIWGP